MPISNQPFLKLDAHTPPRPYLRMRVINPENGKAWDTFGLIDTGADVCCFPAQVATLLGHELQAGTHMHSRTAGGAAKAYAHSTCLELMNLNGDLLLRIPNIQAHYMEGLHASLLGVNGFLDTHQLAIHYPKHLFSITAPKA